MIWFVYTFNCDVFWPLELFFYQNEDCNQRYVV